MKIILSTQNPTKVEEIKAIFNDPSIQVQTLGEAGIEGAPVEDGTTMKENALKKAHFAHERSDRKSWSMSDATALFIPALNGEPGIQSSSWGGKTSAEDIMRYCIQRLEGISDRSGKFETLIVLLSPEGEEYLFSGETFGQLLEQPRVPPMVKMPYSSLFVPEGETRAWAEMSIEEINSTSSRGKAFEKVIAFLSTK